MRNTRLLLIAGILALLPAVASSSSASQDERNTIVITFKDGHQQTFSLADITRVEFKSVPAANPSAAASSATNPPPSARNEFVGKWKVGDGSGGIFSNFSITLNRDGEAEKSIGEPHGTWIVVNGEARITWDDGWHDAIRKVGRTFEKVAFEPGRSFSDQPSNITKAERTDSQPI